MKTIKILILTVVVFLAAFQAVPSNTAVVNTPVHEQQISTNKEPFYIKKLGRDIMPIMGYAPPHGSNPEGVSTPSLINRTSFQTYRDCGFNVFSDLFTRLPVNDQEVYKALDLAAETDLIYLVNDLKFWLGKNSTKTVEEVERDIESLDYLNHKAFGGFVAVDEPGLSYFGGLATFMQAVRNKIPDSYVHCTLFPPYASVSQINEKEWTPGAPAVTAAEYENYVLRYLNEVKPNILLYDQYYDFNHVIDDFWYKYIANYRIWSSQYNMSFMPSIDTRAARNGGEKGMMWQSNTALAFGARGIQYYPYLSGLGVDVAGDSLVTSGGTPNAAYYHVQKANRQIALVDEVLMNSVNKGIMQFGAMKSSQYESLLLDSFGGLTNVAGEALVGCFERNGKSVLYVVNNDYRSGKMLFTLDFNKKVKANITNLNGKTFQIGKTLGITLSGGEAALVELE